MFWSTRKAPVFTYIYYKRKWIKELNVENIDKVSRFRVRQVFKGVDNKEYVNKFKAYLIKKYTDQVFNYDDASVNSIKSVIRKLEIELNQDERYQLERLEELAFAKNRSFKALDVPFLPIRNEYCYFKFEKGIMYKENDKGKLIKSTLGQMYLTNRRIVIIEETTGKEVSARFARFDKISVKKYGVKLEVLSPKKVIVFTCEDNKILGISLKRLMEKED